MGKGAVLSFFSCWQSRQQSVQVERGWLRAKGKGAKGEASGMGTRKTRKAEMVRVAWALGKGRAWRRELR